MEVKTIPIPVFTFRTILSTLVFHKGDEGSRCLLSAERAKDDNLFRRYPEFIAVPGRIEKINAGNGAETGGIQFHIEKGEILYGVYTEFGVLRFSSGYEGLSIKPAREEDEDDKE